MFAPSCVIIICVIRDKEEGRKGLQRRGGKGRVGRKVKDTKKEKNANEKKNSKEKVGGKKDCKTWINLCNIMKPL